MARKGKGGLSDAANQALREVEKCQDFHDQLVRKHQERDEAFRGVLKQRMEAAQWQSQLHPPYVNHIVETTVASLIEDRFAYRVRPRPRFFDEGEFERARKGAKAHEILFRAQLAADRFSEFQRPFALTAAVQGMAVAKTWWRSETMPRKRVAYRNAAPPELAMLGFDIPEPYEVEREEDVFDGPVTECVDLRDFYWHEAAVSLDKARWVAHAVWMSVEDLRRLEQQGVYSNVDDVVPNGSEASQDDAVERERERRGRNKDMVEVLEIWDREKRQVVTLGARKTVLRHAGWPFHHGRYPFVVASLQPYPNSLQGMGIVEKIAHLQEAAWDLMNQRHDGTRLLLNPVYSVRPDIDDVDSLVWEPGALWMNEDPQSVTQLAIDPTPVTFSLPAEGILKQDMQNLAGGHPFTSTSEARGVGADTATEAALVTTLAQQSTKQMKMQLNWAYERIGEQRMLLNQQFIRKPIYVEKIGIDSQEEIEEVLPQLLEGDYKFDVSPMSESLMRSEKRAESNALFQVLMQSAPVLAALGVTVNAAEALKQLLESYDVQDPERFLSSQAPPQMQQPNQAQGAAPTGESPQGVTAQQAIDPAVSPSAGLSMSGVGAMQQFGAGRGGVANT